MDLNPIQFDATTALARHPVLGRIASSRRIGELPHTHRAVPTGSLYHGSVADLKPGDIIYSSADQGREPIHTVNPLVQSTYDGRGWEFPKDQHEHAFAVGNEDVAGDYARSAAAQHQQPGHVYRVSRIGDMEQDPEFGKDSVRSRQGFRVEERIATHQPPPQRGGGAIPLDEI